MNAMRRNLTKGAGGLGAISVAAAAGLRMPARAPAEWNRAAFGARDIKAGDKIVLTREDNSGTWGTAEGVVS
jgi:hypothetical protein